jgi:hypothetical protein
LVVVAFWLIGMLAGLPVLAITLLKVLVVLLAIGWLFGFMGSRITF